MATKTIREIALAWKTDKQRYVKQSPDFVTQKIRIS